jgi:hypothetical protein
MACALVRPSENAAGLDPRLRVAVFPATIAKGRGSYSKNFQETAHGSFGSTSTNADAARFVGLDGDSVQARLSRSRIVGKTSGRAKNIPFAIFVRMNSSALAKVYNKYDAILTCTLQLRAMFTAQARTAGRVLERRSPRRAARSESLFAGASQSPLRELPDPQSIPSSLPKK